MGIYVQLNILTNKALASPAERLAKMLLVNSEKHALLDSADAASISSLFEVLSMHESAIKDISAYVYCSSP